MENKDIEKNIIFETVAGSHSYGTATKDSDTDYRGVCILPQKTYYFGFGLNKFGQKDKGWEKEDRVIYDFRKFIDLAANANPNILELLFTEQQHWIKTSNYWEKLWEHRHKFLSKNVRYRYLGYAWSQMGRIRRHRGYLLNPPKKQPQRSDFGLPQKN
jgi:predicted nucleotidyltransferase